MAHCQTSTANFTDSASSLEMISASAIAAPAPLSIASRIAAIAGSRDAFPTDSTHETTTGAGGKCPQDADKSTRQRAALRILTIQGYHRASQAQLQPFC